jgi:DNA (cytosine-5)-methyltransferase 1
MEIAFQCEIDPFCRRVLDKHWPGVTKYGDIQELRGEDVGAVDLLCGGFPCQDVSVAGRRTGLAGKRSGLFYEFVRLAAEVRPRWLLIENVFGLLSSNEWRDMGAVLWTLGQLGYGYAYRVLDAQWFGVAQRRRRVFIVGCLGDWSGAAAVLCESESCGGGVAPVGAQREVVAATLTGGSATGDGVNAPGRRREDDVNLVVARTVTTRGGRRNDASAETLLAVSTNQRGEGRLRPVHGSLTASRSAKQFDGVMVPVAAFSAGQSPKAGSLGYRDEQSPTLRAGASGTNMVPTTVQGMAVRRLTPLECERLQGFPDNWTLLDDKTADAPRYRACGNAVCVPVAEWIGGRITEADALLRQGEEAS